MRRPAVQKLVHAVTTIHTSGEKPGCGFVLDYHHLTPPSIFFQSKLAAPTNAGPKT